MFCKICSDLLKVTPKKLPFYHTYSTKSSYQSHYEVLKLLPNCTSKDIKNAFIKLSKEHHPDVNKCKQSHVRFQKINEAYKVLGKPETRRDYDLGLVPTRHVNVRRHTKAYYKEEVGRNPYDDPLFWMNRDKRQDEYYRNQSYYGIDGIPRLSNGTILMFCVFFSFIGVGLQYLAISKSFTFRREELMRKSLEVEKILKETRQVASDNGNTVQLENLKIKLLGKASDNKKD